MSRPMLLTADIDAIGGVLYNARELSNKQAGLAIQAVQSHDFLVAALNGVMQMIGCECDCIYSDESNPIQCPCKLARATLAKVQS